MTEQLQYRWQVLAHNNARIAAGKPTEDPRKSLYDTVPRAKSASHAAGASQAARQTSRAGREFPMTQFAGDQPRQLVWPHVSTPPKALPTWNAHTDGLRTIACNVVDESPAGHPIPPGTDINWHLGRRSSSARRPTGRFDEHPQYGFTGLESTFARRSVASSRSFATPDAWSTQMTARDLLTDTSVGRVSAPCADNAKLVGGKWRYVPSLEAKTNPFLTPAAGTVVRTVHPHRKPIPPPPWGIVRD